MESHYLSSVLLSQSTHRPRLSDRDKTCRLRHSINNNPNGIKTPTRSQTSHEIHGDVLPLPLRYWQCMELTSRSAMLYLDLLTSRTLSHESGYIGLQPSPPI